MLRTSLLLAASLGALLAAGPALGQQLQMAPPGAAPTPIWQPAPTTVPNRPDIPNAEVADRIKGVAHPPFATEADKLPLAKLKLPKGFKIEVWASGIPNARTLRLGDKGTVFVSNRLLDKVYAVVDKNGKREIKVIASGLDRPNGLAFHSGALYVAEGTKISRYDNIEDKLDSPPAPVVVYSDLPNHASHGWRYIG